MSFFLTKVLAALDDGGDHVLFHCGGDVTTYRQARDRLRRLHGGLGDVETLAVDLRNRPETVLVQLAALLRGATVLMVPASAPARDRLAAVNGATVVTDRPHDWPAGDVRTLDDLDDEPGPLRPPETVRLLFPTGGTTGTPKLIRHSGIYDGMAYLFTPSPDGPGRTLLVAPMTHMTGNATVLGALLRLDTVVVHDGFDAEAVLDAIQAHRIDTLSLTPPRLAALLDHPARESTDLSSVRSLSLGAAPLPPHRLTQALDVFGPVVGQGYGLTEAPMIASISAAELIARPELRSSVGRIVPGMEARLTDGEVEVRGLSMMDGYLGGPEIGAGWLRTGDLGRFDDEGYLYLLDRVDDVVVVGEHGTKVATTVVEHALAAHPAVRSAAVFGVPGEDGQLLHAVVVASAEVTSEEVRAHARDAFGQEHYVPASVDFVAALPLTSVGKVDKRALRAAFSS
ncbi:fatty acid CoA ligase [Amycolatopsis mediterranei S699]|uniref:Fatty acid CoA ligase n=2 Tax=Amycolatopsis mediterranei TaxID=33910 RepID=A0A9R0P4Q4_AMYMS|nr:AMP-binding protein [Amycolatopsis mediterranei]ADJ49215.1 putative fatty acid CoA ligase [Amycolatopsis mediterranei U32]AEK46177.1 fatty acid CoA ligase [Amycolatopsis mediterranei S699]AFO80924.1 fatty acid CoA ligase [Amycolatopsis mediterranei S699]AGT88052.1 fatty acid CoA ligase [Amycolatopsis mediterranei RB]KDO04196.1 fatty acid--CoA ligase [Amycolatopsis mediterranei]